MMVLVFFLFFLGVFMFYCGLMAFSSLLVFLFCFYLLNGLCLGFVDLGFVDWFFFMDLLSFLMVILSLWSVMVVYLVSMYSGKGLSFFLYYFIFLSLSISFLSSNLYFYYIFFEFSMIPIFFLIVVNGSGQDRLISSYYMMVYTLLSSLPSLFILMDLFLMYGFISFIFWGLMDYFISSIYVVFFLFMFMVKVPLFMFHIWLPKAHVDAPVEGSMILASIMLKLGGYGVFRMMLMFSACFDLYMFFFCVGLLGFIFLSFLVMFIVDVKVLIAYSSVIHMCMMVCGVFSGVFIGWWGGFLMMLSHGVCSSCMFMMANMIYKCSGSRCMFYNKGIHGLLPVYSYFWLSILIYNIGVPPSLSLFSEVYLLMGILGLDSFYLFMLVLGLFFLSCCMFNLYNSLNLDWGGGLFNQLLICDYFMMINHFFPLIFSIFFVLFF